MIVSYLTFLEGSPKGYEELDACPALLERFHLILRVSSVIGRDPKCSNDIMLISMWLFPFDRDFAFNSMWLSLGFIALLINVLVNFLPDSPFSDNKGLEGFTCIVITLSPTGFCVAVVFPLMLQRGRG